MAELVYIVDFCDCTDNWCKLNKYKRNVRFFGDALFLCVAKSKTLVSNFARMTASAVGHFLDDRMQMPISLTTIFKQIKQQLLVTHARSIYYVNVDLMSVYFVHSKSLMCWSHDFKLFSHGNITLFRLFLNHVFCARLSPPKRCIEWPPLEQWLCVAFTYFLTKY